MPVIGVAELLVVPTFKDLQRSVGQQVDAAVGRLPDAPAQKAGGRIGGILSNAIGTALGIGMSKVGDFAMKQVTGVFTSGFKRLADIDVAQAKMRGLGYTVEEVDSLMASALQSVKGTPYGLGDAATVAASAVAAGVKPGEEMNRVLGAVAESAAASGTSLRDMGDLYMDAISKGKVQNDILGRVAERGIPIYATLGEMLGKTNAEVFAMATAGDISAELFQQAMIKASGTVAKELGQTLPGAWENYKAAVSRVGANLMGRLYPQLTQGILDMTKRMAGLEQAAKVVGEGLGILVERATAAWGGLQTLFASGDVTDQLLTALGVDEGSPIIQGLLSLRDAFITVHDWVLQNHQAFEIIGAALAGAAAAFAGLRAVVGAVSGVFGLLSTAVRWAVGGMQALWALMLANPVTATLMAIGALVGALVYLYRTNEDVRRVVDAAWAGIRAAVSAAWEGYIRPALEAFGRFLTDVVGPALQWFADSVVVPVFTWIGDVIAAVWSGAILPVLELFWSFLTTFLGPALVSLWQDVVVPVATAIGEAISRMWTAVVQPALASFWAFLRDDLAPVFVWLWEQVIVPFATYVGGAISDMVEQSRPLFEVMATVAKTAFELIGGAAVWLIERFTDIVIWLATTSPAQAFQVVFDAIGAGLGWLGDLFAGWGRSISDVYTAVIGWGRDLLAPAWQWLADVATGAFSAISGWINDRFLPAVKAIYDVGVKPTVDAASPVLEWFGQLFSNVFLLIHDIIHLKVIPALRAFYDDSVKPKFQAAGDLIRSVWETLIKPAVDALVEFFRDTIPDAARTMGDWVREKWDGMASGIRTAYEQYIKPHLDRLDEFFRKTLPDAARAMREWVQEKWDGMASGIRTAYEQYIKPHLDRLDEFFRKTLPDAARTVKEYVSKRWDELGSAIRSVYNDKVKPILEGFGKFFTETLPARVREGVDGIRKAWETITELFRKPINWVIRTVWNQGLKGAFDGVAKAVGSSARLPDIPEIGRYARGGRVREEWAWVGEHGPELVYTGDRSPHIFPAQQSKRLAQAATEQPLEGDAAVAAERAQAGIGGGFGDFLRGLDQTLTGGAISRAIEWTLGKLAEGAKGLLDPLFAVAKAHLGGLGPYGALLVDTAANMIDQIVKWTTKQDEEAMPGVNTVAGLLGGGARPSGGRVTSWFGPREFAGMDFHRGIDFAGGQGGRTYAYQAGQVLRTGPGATGDDSWSIVLDHGGGWQTWYLHNPVGGITVKPGDRVKRGQHIGHEGQTGVAYGDHLHFGMYHNGQLKDPNALFRDRGGNLPPGLSMVLNQTGADEYILNRSQAAQLAHAAQQGRGVPSHMTVRIGDQEFRGYVEDIGDARLAQHVAGLAQPIQQTVGAL